ncbi:MAG: hypothetical protein OEZ15_10705, partial [Gammaproteobacteria bacterium]|nr:hypothetical protein [Gammaproteobacteria bacterium]
MTVHNTEIHEGISIGHLIAVYLLDTADKQSELLARDLQNTGYAISQFQEMASLLDAVHNSAEDKLPAVVILEAGFTGSQLEPGINSAIQYCQEHNTAVILYSDRNDLPARLASVRAGASHFLPQPVDYILLTRLIDNLAISSH